MTMIQSAWGPPVTKDLRPLTRKPGMPPARVAGSARVRSAPWGSVKPKAVVFSPRRTGS